MIILKEKLLDEMSVEPIEEKSSGKKAQKARNDYKKGMNNRLKNRKQSDVSQETIAKYNREPVRATDKNIDARNYLQDTRDINKARDDQKNGNLSYDPEELEMYYSSSKNNAESIDRLKEILDKFGVKNTSFVGTTIPAGVMHQWTKNMKWEEITNRDNVFMATLKNPKAVAITQSEDNFLKCYNSYCDDSYDLNDANNSGFVIYSPSLYKNNNEEYVDKIIDYMHVVENSNDRRQIKIAGACLRDKNGDVRNLRDFENNLRKYGLSITGAVNRQKKATPKNLEKEVKNADVEVKQSIKNILNKDPELD